MTKTKKKIIIIDALALIFRAYYALPPMINDKGVNLNAVYGFTNTLFNILKQYTPEYICVAFDLPKPTFRKKMFEAYKAQREAPPEDFGPQVTMIRELLDLLNIQTYSQEGFEADDVIGSICKKKSIDNSETMSYILTGDLDTLQLVDDNTHVITFKKGMSEVIEYNIEAVATKYEGLRPDQVIDLKALKGDTSDNVPGVKGVGEKTALTLIQEFGTLDNVYKNIDSEKIRENLREKLKTDEKIAYISKELVTIVTDVDIKFNLEDCILKEYNREAVVEKFNEYQFKTLIGKLPNIKQEKVETLQIHSNLSGDNLKYHFINSDEQFDDFISKISSQKLIAFDSETTGLDQRTSEIVGLSFSWEKSEAYYIPITSQKSSGLFADKTFNKEWLIKLKPILENSEIKKVGHNSKFDIQVLKNNGIEVKGLVFDTMVAAYLLNAGTRSYSLDELALEEFGFTKISYETLTTIGKTKIPLIEVAQEMISQYACEDADFTFRLYEKYSDIISKESLLMNLMNTIEMPLVEVLAKMEDYGVLIDSKFLGNLSKVVSKKLATLEEKIHELAGESFNIASPLQLQKILFEKLLIPTTGIAKTKTGFSTASTELEKLNDQHAIIPLISEHRELSKLRSTYLDALPEMINKKTGRVHTNYNQTIAATGRLSSTDPNLQNIPIRTELGNEVRKAFIAPAGYKIISADYSQIELRLAAHYSKDPSMIEAFKSGKDIHTITAAKIHGIPESEVTKEIRSTAKEINFGIIYGLGSVGLSSRTEMNRKEAKEFIETYFKNFPGIKNYISESVQSARKVGYAETIFGRRRYLPDIDSGNQMLRAGAERVAVNMPLQGTAADLIKIAMIQVQNELEKSFPETKMIMQVHDELVFEVPEKDVPEVSKVVKKIMESVYEFDVPIKVDVEVGDNWGELGELGKVN